MVILLPPTHMKVTQMPLWHGNNTQEKPFMVPISQTHPQGNPKEPADIKVTC